MLKYSQSQDKFEEQIKKANEALKSLIPGRNDSSDAKNVEKFNKKLDEIKLKQ